MQKSNLDLFVDKKKISRILDKKELDNTESKFLFSLINAQMFLKQNNIQLEINEVKYEKKIWLHNFCKI